MKNPHKDAVSGYRTANQMFFRRGKENERKKEQLKQDPDIVYSVVMGREKTNVTNADKTVWRNASSLVSG